MALYHTVFLALAGHCWQAAASALNAAPAVVHPRQTTPQLLLPVPLQNTGSGHPDAEPALRTSESWYWGLDSSRAHVNFTGYYDGPLQKVISMDRVAPWLSSSSCSESHDSLMFSFKSQSTYEQTKREWDWVNGMTFRSFIMTVDIPGCQVGANQQGNGVGRQPYQVNGIKWDDAGHLATLSAMPKTWDDAVAQTSGHGSSPDGGSSSSSSSPALTGNSWEMFVDSKGLAAPSSSKLKRLSADHSGSIALDHDFSQKIFQQTVQGVDVSLDCSSCLTQGTLDFQIHVIPITFPPKLEGFVQVTPNAISATAVVALKASGQTGSGISQAVRLATVPLPGGFGVAGVANFGPTLEISIQSGLSSISGTADASFGVRLDVPADSIAKVDLSQSSNNELSGWVPTFTPIPPTFNAEFSVTASVAPQIIVALEATVLGFGLSAGLALLAPKLQGNLAAQVDSAGGVCGIQGASAGVNFGLGIGAELDAFAGVGKAEDLPGKLPILTTSVNLFSTCLGLDNTVTATPTYAPVTIVPVTNVPVTNVPVTNVPVTNVPVTNVPVTNVPVTNVPVTIVPVSAFPEPTTAHAVPSPVQIFAFTPIRAIASPKA